MQLPEMQENRRFSVQKPLSQLSEGNKSVPRIHATHWLEGTILTDLCNNVFFFNNLKPETLSNNIVWGLKKQTKIIQFYHTLIHERRLYWLLITMRYEREKKKISIHIFSDHPLLTMSHFSWKSGQLHSVLPKGGTGISVAKISYFNKSSCICLLVQTRLC